MKYCFICNEKLAPRKKLYCSNKCSIKAWKIRDREQYLESKRLYRQRNKEKILAYTRTFKAKYKVSDKLYEKIKNVLLKNAVCIRCSTTEKLNIHHIRPLSAGGNNHLSNLTVLCFSCHMEWHKVFPSSYWLPNIVLPIAQSDILKPSKVTKTVVEKKVVYKVRPRKKRNDSHLMIPSPA